MISGKPKRVDAKDLRVALPAELQAALKSAFVSGDGMVSSFLDFELCVEVPLPYDILKYEVVDGNGCVVVSWVA